MTFAVGSETCSALFYCATPACGRQNGEQTAAQNTFSAAPGLLPSRGRAVGGVIGTGRTSADDLPWPDSAGSGRVMPRANRRRRGGRRGGGVWRRGRTRASLRRGMTLLNAPAAGGPARRERFPLLVATRGTGRRLRRGRAAPRRALQPCARRCLLPLNKRLVRRVWLALSPPSPSFLSFRLSGRTQADTGRVWNSTTALRAALSLPRGCATSPAAHLCLYFSFLLRGGTRQRTWRGTLYPGRTERAGACSCVRRFWCRALATLWLRSLGFVAAWILYERCENWWLWVYRTFLVGIAFGRM